MKKKKGDLVRLIQEAQEVIETDKSKSSNKTENAAIVLYRDLGAKEDQINIRKEILKTYCKKRGYNIALISIRKESGLFVESPELIHLVDLVKEGKIDVIVISNPFDISPTSFPLIKKLFASVGEKGARIEIVSSMFDALK